MSILPRVFQHAWMDAGIASFREQVRRYVERELTPHVPAWRAQGYIPREIWRGFGEHGFLLPEMDEQWGGGGGNLRGAGIRRQHALKMLRQAHRRLTVASATITRQFVLTAAPGEPVKQRRGVARPILQVVLGDTLKMVSERFAHHACSTLLSDVLGKSLPFPGKPLPHASVERLRQAVYYRAGRLARNLQ